MTFNIELAEKVLAKLTANPDVHYQGEWRAEAEGVGRNVGGCGTVMCLAGWAGVLDNGTWVTDDPNHPLYDVFVAEPGDDPTTVHTWDDPGDPLHGVKYVVASVRGQRVLGLTEERADELFEGGHEGEALAKLRRSISSAKAARTRATA